MSAFAACATRSERWRFAGAHLLERLKSPLPSRAIPPLHAFVQSRPHLETRPVVLTPGANKHAEGSCMVEFGDTRVLTTCSVEDRVPPHIFGTGAGWVTAEYGMLPRATHERTAREAAQGQAGRPHARDSAARLGGRCAPCVDMPRRSACARSRLDCDVIQADGGTRTASITGAYVALALARAQAQGKGRGSDGRQLTPVAAISVGMVKSERQRRPRLRRGLERPRSILNVVALEGGRLIEVQGTAEHGHFERPQLDAMLDSEVSPRRSRSCKSAQALG